jgi:hypothetical protein
MYLTTKDYIAASPDLGTMACITVRVSILELKPRRSSKAMRNAEAPFPSYNRPCMPTCCFVLHLTVPSRRYTSCIALILSPSMVEGPDSPVIDMAPRAEDPLIPPQPSTSYSFTCFSAHRLSHGMSLFHCYCSDQCRFIRARMACCIACPT